MKIKELLFYVCVGIMIFSIALVINKYTENTDKDIINKWVLKKNINVKSIDSHAFCVGTPFKYSTKGHNIYEIKTINGETYWFRYGIFNDDFVKE